MFQQNQVNQKNATAAIRRTRNQQKGMICEGVMLPVRITDCQEGRTTQSGSGKLRYSFQHIVSKEAFSSTVFENSVPDYIDQKIVDVALPPEMVDYTLQDLVDRGLFVQVGFYENNGFTHINVKKVAPLDETHQSLLNELLEAEVQDRQAYEAEMKELEDEMD